MVFEFLDTRYNPMVILTDHESGIIDNLSKSPYGEDEVEELDEFNSGAELIKLIELMNSAPGCFETFSISLHKDQWNELSEIFHRALAVEAGLARMAKAHACA